ncbi:bifunctional polysaccharide deacetylase/glycosyltransferase family 2 protein [Nonomuraea dietziae]|uniref:Cellulose synthase/poly-beta-1,6-N-acetylglucosamine synthase-like glycosyltransferase/peptidoglycan/xylan/chitin deacetylase (PgdA/CDA1 family) n=1 Tax=Nonomuraea dietziae TaxID=65515 RepID=A0A7W5VBS2_9ACTN|nr:bifunctional polysaccharide deacetylase/glycosyltransferase family 2 protein [Nonomuraea dietziae]MBB3728925.1 cellulose synthase/poly-beta-1,6-N-acetylglucosamine synthase-like glycosyltransferase/peptidoglycan/xylan/chitin deacetylase (PgdA/CDA1 family) [Nonomuraea dietziae]
MRAPSPQDKQVWPPAPLLPWQDTGAAQPEEGRRKSPSEPPGLSPQPVRKATDPRGHWLLLAVGLLLASGALVLNGYVTNVVGETHAAPPAAGPPSPELERVRRGGPMLNLTGSQVASVRLPAKTLALTFDDGPDPAWTPQVLDALKKHGAKATFFAVGSKIAQHPELTRRIVAEGHEIGNHTYAHADLSEVPGWRLGLELSLTQQALAGATGLHTTLARPPYSSTPAAVTGPQWESLKAVADRGYLLVLTDLDTKDWARPGSAQIVKAALPSRGRGAIVMMHDAGGDRRQTVEAVDRVLGALADQGYRGVTVTQALGMPSAHRQAKPVERFAGAVLNVAQRGSKAFTESLSWVLFAAGVLTLARLGFFAVLAWVHARRTRGGRRRRGRAPAWLAPPPVTVIVPAYNEAAGIQATIRSLVNTTYQGALEVLVVDDGSTDDTAALAAALAFDNVRVIRQHNGGKPSALNTGITHARHELLVMVDGDTVFEPATIGQLIRQLADPTVGAVSGNTKVGNRRGMIGRWQHIEYVIGFNLDRRAFELLDCMATVPGAIGAFRRSALIALGGVSTDTLAEDTDLTMALCRAGWRVVYEEKALAWTEAPTSLGQLWKQRYRWCYGTLQAMWKHRRAVLERASFGRRCLGYLTLFQVVLPLLAPVVDLMAVYSAAVGDPLPVVAVWGGFVIVQALTGWYALRLDGERASALWVLPLQQFVYRQLMYLVVIQSVATAVLGVRLRWHTVRREGTFDASPLPRTPAGTPS